MKISDVMCPKCGSSYLMAESVTIDGRPGQEDCHVCGNRLATWSDRNRRAFRLVLSSDHKYPPVSLRRIYKALRPGSNARPSKHRIKSARRGDSQSC